MFWLPIDRHTEVRSRSIIPVVRISAAANQESIPSGWPFLRGDHNLERHQTSEKKQREQVTLTRYLGLNIFHVLNSQLPPTRTWSCPSEVPTAVTELFVNKFHNVTGGVDPLPTRATGPARIPRPAYIIFFFLICAFVQSPSKALKSVPSI